MIEITEKVMEKYPDLEIISNIHSVIIWLSTLDYYKNNPSERFDGQINLPIDVSEASLSANNYPYFVNNIACILPNPFKRIVNASNIVRFDCYSYAFNLSLMYENLMLRGD